MEINVQKQAHVFTVLFLSLLFCSIWAGSPKKHFVQADQLFTVEQCIKNPLRMAADNSGNIYICNGHNYICRYDSGGNYLGKITTASPPLAVAISGASLYASMRNFNQITQMDTSGTIIRTFGNFLLASDMAFDGNQHLYVTDSRLKQVFVFDRAGNLLKSFGKDVLVFPTGIAIDEKNQLVLVTEHGGIAPADTALPIAAIHVFDKQGNWLRGYGQYGNEDGQFVRMQGLAVDQLGRMFVADSYQGMIQVLDKNGAFLGLLGQFGYGPNKLAQPMDVILDKTNHLWVTSYNSNAVLVFDIKGLPTVLSDDTPLAVPLKNELMQNYPNPFNSGTVIPFSLGQDGSVTINIYNCAGQKVRSACLGEYPKGSYPVKGKAYYWDGKNDAGKSVASGLYYYEIRLQNYHAVKRMLLIK